VSSQEEGFWVNEKRISVYNSYTAVIRFIGAKLFYIFQGQ